MFGIGLPELVVVLVIALLIFGPKGLPDVGRTVGRWIFEIRNSVQGLSEEFKDSLNFERPHENTQTHEPPPDQGEGEQPKEPGSEGRASSGRGPDGGG